MTHLPQHESLNPNNQFYQRMQNITLFMHKQSWAVASY